MKAKRTATFGEGKKEVIGVEKNPAWSGTYSHDEYVGIIPKSPTEVIVEHRRDNYPATYKEAGYLLLSIDNRRFSSPAWREFPYEGARKYCSEDRLKTAFEKGRKQWLVWVADDGLVLVNDHGFTWDAGNRHVFSAVKSKDGWKVIGGHVWESGSPELPQTLGAKKAPYLNPNTGQWGNGEWAAIPADFTRPSDWRVAGEWCEELHKRLCND